VQVHYKEPILINGGSWKLRRQDRTKPGNVSISNPCNFDQRQHKSPLRPVDSVILDEDAIGIMRYLYDDPVPSIVKYDNEYRSRWTFCVVFVQSCRGWILKQSLVLFAFVELEEVLDHLRRVLNGTLFITNVLFRKKQHHIPRIGNLGILFQRYVVVVSSYGRITCNGYARQGP
jgi:hypothetical protein